MRRQIEGGGDAALVAERRGPALRRLLGRLPAQDVAGLARTLQEAAEAYERPGWSWAQVATAWAVLAALALVIVLAFVG